METTLTIWIKTQLSRYPHIQSPEALSLERLTGDAGFRQYYELNTQPRLLAVTAPETPGNSERAIYFSRLAGVLRQQGIPVPQVLACDEAQNFLLLEHFGRQDFLDVLNLETADLLYGEALVVLLRLQQMPSTAIDLPPYDQALLRTEMNLFVDWFVGDLLDYSLTPDEHDVIDRAFVFLETLALEQPQVAVHRDYHSRNLMYREGEAPGVIDFQDAVRGPITYDLVSLLRDCYIQWPQAKVQQWALSYLSLSIDAGVITAVSETQWLRWFDAMGLQRHIKVLGIFARLHLRDGKARYLNDLPLVWYYTLSVAQQIDALQDFTRWCQQRLLPLVEKQNWYRSPKLVES